MIEVERKFHLSAAQEQRLIEGAALDSTKEHIDAYYDNEFHRLTVSNKWLRKRDGVFDLKVPLTKKPVAAVSTTIYREFETDDEIRTAINLEVSAAPLEADLHDAGFSQFCLAKSVRRKYLKDGFTIALDTVSYPDVEPTFTVAEIEKLVATEEEVPAAQEAILTFAARHGLSTEGVVLGKVPFYLEHKDPEHLALLLANKVFSS